ncbi:hypothetical protein D3C78_484060 [compost metagenome]
MSSNPRFPGLDLSSIDSVRKHIFNDTYTYSIPGYFRYSAEYNQKVGHLSTGSKQMDQQVMSEYVHIGGSITDILKLFKRGADIKFEHKEDIVTIYEALIAHLNFWANYMRRDPNVKDAPLNDLYLMSDFAESIKIQVMGFKPNVQDVPALKRVSMLFGGLEGAEELFNPSGVGSTVEPTAPILGRIEKLMAERNAPKK